MKTKTQTRTPVVGGTPSSRARRRYTRALRAAYPDGGPQAPAPVAALKGNARKRGHAADGNLADTLRATVTDRTRYQLAVGEHEVCQLFLAYARGEAALRADQATVTAIKTKQHARKLELKAQQRRLAKLRKEANLPAGARGKERAA